jgi:hypothetical protein
LRSKIFRNFSLFPKINPYCFNEADKRFNLYQPFVLRVLEDGFRAEGPASVVFPGIPMEIYSSSNTAFLAPASGITRAFIGDSYSDLKVTTNLNCDTYPLITIPALLFLYQKFRQKNNETNPAMIAYNETAITNIDGIMPCITGLNSIGESIESICAHEELVKEIDQIVFYKKDEGSFFKLVIEDEGQPEAKFSSLIESPNKIIDLFSSGKIRAHDEVKFAKNALTKDNFDNNPELKEFSYHCYSEAVQEVAFYIVTKKNNEDVFNDPFNSPLLEILIKDAQSLISTVGKEKIISAFEISNVNPETSVRNPLLIKSFNRSLDEIAHLK